MKQQQQQMHEQQQQQHHSQQQHYPAAPQYGVQQQQQYQQGGPGAHREELAGALPVHTRPIGEGVEGPPVKKKPSALDRVALAEQEALEAYAGYHGSSSSSPSPARSQSPFQEEPTEPSLYLAINLAQIQGEPTEVSSNQGDVPKVSHRKIPTGCI